MTKTHWTNLGVAVALLGGFGLLSVYAQDKEVTESITKLAGDSTKKSWADLTKDGAAVAKKHELVDIMNLFKLRKTGAKTSGWGVGEKPGGISPDGIEAKIINMTKNPMPDATLAKQQADLIQMAERVKGIAAATIHQCPVPAKQGAKDPAKWKEWMEEMNKASDELIKALKDKKPEEVKKAANKLNGTCTECHGVFRDS
jgi:mevalonate kinase